MKDIKWNRQFKDRIISGGLSLVLVTTGYCLGKCSTNEIITNALDDYILQREKIEKDIEELTIQRELLLIEKEQMKNIKYFDYSNLVVVELLGKNNQENLYICEGSFDNPFLREYNNEFSVIYEMSGYEWVTDVFPDYMQINNYTGIVSFLTDEELENVVINNGKIAKCELDEILIRIRNDYNNKLRVLSKN